MSRLLIFGYGFAGRALARRLDDWTLAATHRRAELASALVRDGVTPVVATSLAREVAQADAILVTAPPDANGCPGLEAMGGAIAARASPPWLGYLSTTGVYGDRGGGWVFEADPPSPISEEGRRRAAAEAGWLALGAAVFRLPSIYGPGRSAIDRLREGTARRIVRPGQVFSRIHVDDLATGVAASIAAPRPGAIYNLCDDEPAPNPDVIAFAAGLLGLPVPPEEPFESANLTPAAARFYAESKRVSNTLAKAELGWRPVFPSYREGLRAILAAEA